MTDVFELACMHAESLYELDAGGRIARVREPAAREPPRFALVRSRAGNIALVRHDVAANVAARLLEMAASEPLLGDPESLPAHRDAYVAVLSAQGPLDRVRAGPAFLLPAPEGVPEDVARISEENAALLERHLPWALEHPEAHDPQYVVAEDGAAVAVCRSAREPSRGIEAGVFTVEGYRGRGYAQRVTAAWAHELARRGRLPLYSTWWENVASRRVAERLGGELYAVDFSIR